MLRKKESIEKEPAAINAVLAEFGAPSSPGTTDSKAERGTAPGCAQPGTGNRNDGTACDCLSGLVEKVCMWIEKHVRIQGKRAANIALIIGLVGIGSSAVVPLPWDLDIFRIHFRWSSGPKFFETHNTLVVSFATLCVAFILSPILGGRTVGSLTIPRIEGSSTRQLVTWIGWIGLVLLVVNFVGFPKFSNEQWARTTNLRKMEEAIENATVYTTNETKTAQSVEEHYKVANNEFLSALNSSNNFNHLIFVTAAGGFGKSFLVNHLQSSQPDSIFVFRLVAYGDKWSVPDLLVDLQDNRVTLNYLLDIPNQKQLELLNEIRGILLTRTNATILIDDFDEIDPGDAHLILTQLAMIAEEPGHSRRMVGVGRPEAFSSFMTDPRRPAKRYPKWISLKPPHYSSKGDVETLVNFIYEDLRRRPTDNELKAVHLLLENNRYLIPMLGNLAQANEIVKFARETDARVLIRMRSEEVKESFYGFLLTRNSNTHKRPSANEPKHLSIYSQVLRQIAYLKANKIESDGSFKAAYFESVSVGGATANIQSVLNRSGLVEVEPLDTTFVRYRFWPFWVHRYLVETRNREIGGISIVRSFGIIGFAALSMIGLLSRIDVFWAAIQRKVQSPLKLAKVNG